MKKEFEIKIDTGYHKNIFFQKDGKLDITNSVDALSMYPVKIELRTVVEDEDKTGELIATIIGYYFDMDYMTNEGVFKFGIFDGYSQETCELYEALFEEDEYREELEVVYQNLFYLDSIIVEEEYRGEGYCTMLINQLDEILKYIAKLNVGVIATRIYEFETCDKIDSIEYLSKEEKQELKTNLTNMFINDDYKFLENDNNYLVKVLY